MAVLGLSLSLILMFITLCCKLQGTFWGAIFVFFFFWWDKKFGLGLFSCPGSSIPDLGHSLSDSLPLKHFDTKSNFET